MAQTISGTNLATNWAAASAQPCFRLQVKWDGSNWTDESDYLLRASLKRGLINDARDLAGLGRVAPATLSLTLMNPYTAGSGFRYSPTNASGPLYSDISDGLYRFEMDFECGYHDATNGDERLIQFTGYIELPTVLDSLEQQEAVFTCVDYAAPIMEKPHFNTLAQNQRTDAIIDTLLTAASITNDDLDVGICTIPYYWSVGDYLWDELQDVAASEGGRFYFAKDAEARFETIAHWLAGTDHTVSQLTLSEDDWITLNEATDWRNAYYGIDIEYQVYEIGASKVVYRYAEDIVLSPSEVFTLHAQFSRAVYSLTTPASGTDYEALSAGNADLSSDLSISMTTYAGKAEIEFTNNNASQTMYVSGFQLRGMPLVGLPQQLVRKESALSLVPSDKYLQPSRNLNVQSRVQAEMVASMLRDWLERPRRIYTMTVPCPCWLEMGDRVTVDASDMGIDEAMYVVRMNQDLDVATGRYVATLGLLPVTDLYKHDDYFIWDTSDYADSGADPLFY